MEAAIASPTVRHNYPHRGIYPKNEMNRMGAMLSAISADNGMRVTVDPFGVKFIGPNEGEQAIFHFEIFFLSSTSIGLRGGRYNRYAVDLQNTLQLGVFPGWKDGAASVALDTSGSVDDYRTVTGLNAASTTYFIILTLSDFGLVDDSLFPDTLTASAVTAYPTGDTTKVKLVIGTVTTNSDGEIADIEQFWSGGDADDFFLIPDGISLDYVPDDTGGIMGKEEIKGWQNTAVSDPVAENAEYMFRPNGGGNPAFATFITAAKAVTSWTGVDLTGASWTDHDTQITHDHGELTGNDDDDHDGPDYGYFILGGAGGADPLGRRGPLKSDWYTRNTFTGEENYMGRTLFIETAVNVDIINAEDATGPFIDVANQTLEDSGTVTVAWVARQLKNGDWTVDNALHANDEVKGGVVGDYEATIGDVDNNRSGAFKDLTRTFIVCDDTRAAIASDGTNLVELADGSFAVEAVVGGIAVSTAADVFSHNGNLGFNTGQNVRLTLVGGGGFVDVFLRGGLCTVT